jgi:hypothetical protein
LALAAAALKWRILVGDVVLRLVNNLVQSTLVTFTGLISMGGYLELDLNGKTITVDHGGSAISYGYNFQGPYYSRIVGNSTIYASANFPTTAFVKFENDNGALTYQVTFDADSRAMAACVYVQVRAKVLFYTSTAFSNVASLTSGVVQVTSQAEVVSTVALATKLVQTGASIIGSAGQIITAGGTLTPTP